MTTAKRRSAEVAAIYAEKSLAIQKIGLPEHQLLWDMLREFAQTTFNSSEKRAFAYNRISEVSKPIIRAYGLLGDTEHRIRSIETALFDDLQQIFSVELSDRFHRGAIARIFF